MSKFLKIFLLFFVWSLSAGNAHAVIEFNDWSFRSWDQSNYSLNKINPHPDVRASLQLNKYIYRPGEKIYVGFDSSPWARIPASRFGENTFSVKTYLDGNPLSDQTSFHTLHPTNNFSSFWAYGRGRVSEDSLPPFLNEHGLEFSQSEVDFLEEKGSFINTTDVFSLIDAPSREGAHNLTFYVYSATDTSRLVGYYQKDELFKTITIPFEVVVPEQAPSSPTITSNIPIVSGKPLGVTNKIYTFNITSTDVNVGDTIIYSADFNAYNTDDWKNISVNRLLSGQTQEFKFYWSTPGDKAIKFKAIDNKGMESTSSTYYFRINDDNNMECNSCIGNPPTEIENSCPLYLQPKVY